MPIGQRITSPGRYIAHPPAASGWLADGDALDSGTAHLVHSNLSHLSAQNARLLGHQRGPGWIGQSWAFGGPFSGIVDASYDPDADEYGQHPWVQPTNALCLGPFPLAFTALQTSPPGFIPRQVRVAVQVRKGAVATTTLNVMAALVLGSGTPIQTTPLARDRVAIAASGVVQHKLVEFDLLPSAPVRPFELWRSRPSGTDAAADTLVAPCSVWVGWTSDDATNQLDAVWSVSAFELAE